MSFSFSLFGEVVAVRAELSKAPRNFADNPQRKAAVALILAELSQLSPEQAVKVEASGHHYDVSPEAHASGQRGIHDIKLSIETVQYGFCIANPYAASSPGSSS